DRVYDDSSINDLCNVTLSHDAHDVLYFVVNFAFDGVHHDLAGRAAAVPGDAIGEIARLFLFHEGHQIGDRLLHDPRRFHHLWQEHFAVAKEIADDIHAYHQQAFAPVDRTAGNLP